MGWKAQQDARLSRLTATFGGGRPFSAQALRLARVGDYEPDPKVFMVEVRQPGRVDIRLDPVTNQVIGATAYPG